MANADKHKKALEIYESMCSALSKNDLHFKRHDEDLVITFGIGGDDIPMEFVMQVNENAQVIRLFSMLPFTISEDKLVDTALATVYVNDKILNGAFNFDIFEKKLSFNVLTAYHDSIIGDDVFIYMIAIASSTVDEYNDRFMMLNKDLIDLKKFIAMDDKDK